jgi:hypothetical protein
MSDQRNQQGGGGQKPGQQQQEQSKQKPGQAGKQQEEVDKKTAKKRATIPAAPALAPKNLCEAEKYLLSAPARGLLFWSAPPILLGLTLHRRRFGIFDLHSMRRSPRPIG